MVGGNNERPLIPQAMQSSKIADDDLAALHQPDEEAKSDHDQILTERLADTAWQEGRENHGGKTPDQAAGGEHYEQTIEDEIFIAEAKGTTKATASIRCDHDVGPNRDDFRHRGRHREVLRCAGGTSHPASRLRRCWRQAW